MPHRVEVAQHEDMHELMTILWRCFEEPYQGILRVFFPILNDDRETSLLEASNGQLEEYKASYPELIWLKVVDEQTNKIVAGAKWFFYERNPFVRQPGDDESHDPMNEQAVWYPEGVGRDFATLAMHAHEDPRMRLAQKPHSFLNIIFTLPEYQRQGIGNAMLNWGLAHADKLGLETWLDASVYGYPVYKKLGFLTYALNRVSIKVPAHYTEEQKKEWKHYEETLLPVEHTVMWRPKGGIFIVGETVKPWEN